MELQELIISINCASMRYHRVQQKLSAARKQTDSTLQRYYHMIGAHMRSHSTGNTPKTEQKTDALQLQHLSKSLYRALCKAHHPDVAKTAPETMPRINQAYEQAKRGEFGELLACCHELNDKNCATYMSLNDMRHYYRMLGALAEQMQAEYDIFIASDAYCLAQRLSNSDVMVYTAFKVAQEMRLTA